MLIFKVIVHAQQNLRNKTGLLCLMTYKSSEYSEYVKEEECFVVEIVAYFSLVIGPIKKRKNLNADGSKTI